MKSISEYIMYNPHEIQLAEEIATKLNDPKSIKQFLRYTKRHSHKILRQKLNYVLSLPDWKIETSRVAYFVFLIEQLENSSAFDLALDSDDEDGGLGL